MDAVGRHTCGIKMGNKLENMPRYSQQIEMYCSTLAPWSDLRQNWWYEGGDHSGKELG